MNKDMSSNPISLHQILNRIINLSMIESVEYDKTIFIIKFACNPSWESFDIKYYQELMKAWEKYYNYKEGRGY